MRQALIAQYAKAVVMSRMPLARGARRKTREAALSVQGVRQMVASVADLWADCGMTIVMMDAKRHHRLLAIASHLHRLIAETIVGTANQPSTDLEEVEKRVQWF